MSPNNRLFLPKSLLLMLGGFVFAFVFFLASPVKSLYAQAAVIEQCANNSDGSNDTCTSNGNIGWINSNVNAQKGDYKEGDFLPIRQILKGLTATNYYCFGIGWDVTSSTLPAVDYIGNYNATLPNADPTENTIHSGNGVDDTIAIPNDPALTGTIMGNSFTGSQQAGVLSLWGGTFDNTSLTYSSPNTNGAAHPATSPQSLEYCFTANSSEVILSFGLHIAVGAEWGGLGRPSGSPYHASNGTRNGQFTNPIRTSEQDLACLAPGDDPASDATHQNIGRQEVQMSVQAIESGTIKIVKNISTGSDATFTFDVQDSTPAQVANPSVTTSGGMGMSEIIVVSPGIFSIEETLPSDWSLVPDETACVGAKDGGTLSGTKISDIDIANEDNVICTFTNEEDTLISLASFSAENAGDGATVTWITSAEIDNAGFNVYSSASVNGPWTKVNDTLIPAEGSPSSTTSYSLIDEAGANYYMLEDVDTKGTTTQHSPVSANGSVSGTNSMLPTVFIPYF